MIKDVKSAIVRSKRDSLDTLRFALRLRLPKLEFGISRGSREKYSAEEADGENGSSAMRTPAMQKKKLMGLSLVDRSGSVGGSNSKKVTIGGVINIHNRPLSRRSG